MGHRLHSSLISAVIIMVSILVSIVLAEIYLRGIGRLYFTNLFRPDYELSYTHKHHLETEIFGTTIRTNNVGIRHGDDLPSPQNADKLIILALGDSLTFGYGLEAHESWPANLERLLLQKYPDHEIEVINAGVTSYDTFQEYQQLLRLAELIDIDFVIVGFWHNDTGISEHYAYRDLPGFMQFKRLYYDSRLIPLARYYMNRILTGGERGEYNVRTDLKSDYTSVNAPKFSLKTNPQFQRIIEAFDGLRMWRDSQNVPVYVVYLPHYLHGDDQTVDELLYKRIRDVVSRSGLHFIDGRGAYRDYSGDVVDLSLMKERNDDHTSALGNRIISQFILAKVGDHLDEVVRRRP